MPPTEQDIRNSLKHIIDPDLNSDIVSLGFVQNIRIEGEKVSFDIALTTPACPVKYEFQRQARESVLKLPGVKDVNVNLTAQPKSRPTTPEGIKSPLDKVRSIIAISSCKGGVGKSTIAAHLALEIANRGYKVGLVDTDIHGPSVPALFNLPDDKVRTNDLQQLVPVEFQNLKIMSFGLLLGDAPAVLRGPMVTRYVQQMMLNTDWGKLDYLFVDMPPGTGDVQITLTQSVRLSGAVIVTTKHTLSLVDVARGILMFEKVTVPILGVIENMSFFADPNTGEKHYIFGESKSGTLQERFGVETLGEIPVLPQLSEKITGYTANQYVIDACDKLIRALGKNSMRQKELPEVSFDDKTLKLLWPDGEEAAVDHLTLRLNSKDALSVNELTGEQILKKDDIRPDIKPVKITPLGNYALGISWNDGHSAGIYPYRLIKELSGSSAIVKRSA